MRKASNTKVSDHPTELEKVANLYQEDIALIGYQFDGFNRKKVIHGRLVDHDANEREGKPALLMNAKWDSDVGYSWWLMESYWALLAEIFSADVRAILAYPSISKLPEVIESSSLEVFEVDFAHFGFRYIWRQVRFIKANRVRYLYLTDSPIRHWGYLFFHLAGVERIAVHDHTPGLRTAPKGPKRLLKAWLARLPFINADVLIGATDFVHRRLTDVVCAPPRKCHTVPNGIAPGTPEWGDVYMRFQIDPSKSIIVSVARANEYKGVRFSLNVLAELKQRHPSLQWHYLFMGDGPDREAFIHLAKKLGLTDLVSFPGRVEGAARYLKGCAIAFHPAKGEVGYSLAILEYMQAGLPTLVPNNPSVCEATKDGVTGRIYPKNEVFDATEKIAEYLNNPNLRAEHGKAAQLAIKQHYSLVHSHSTLVCIIQHHLLGLERS
jgi:glycosyltransferase involved in cell wall biosynthesis